MDFAFSWPNSLYRYLCALLILPSLLLASATVTAPASCLPDQRSALLQLKEGFTNSNLTSWQPGTDCCQGWEGVSCDESSGHVTGLDLSTHNFQGNLTVAIFSLTSLQRLNLAYNNFSEDRIPDGFENLTNLTHLSLSSSNFIGQIPIGIANLTNLISLDLSYNWGLRLHKPSLRTLISKLNNLRELRLDYVDVSENGAEWCGALFESVPLLRVLSMRYCNLSGPIEPSLSQLNSLTYIDLSLNSINSSVPDYFADFPLKYLQLSFCDLIGLFPHNIFQILTLTLLDVSFNTELLVTLPDFPLGISLESLILYESNLSSPIPDSIGNLQNLSYLSLSGCYLSGQIPSSIAKLSKLEILDLSYNSFSGSIPQTLFVLPNLDILYLSNNKLFQFKLDETSIMFSPLSDLDLSFNQLNGSIPREIYKLSNLKTLDLSWNHFSGPISNWILGLSSLQSLDLDSNNFNGTFQLSLLQHLPNLTGLYLSNNQLSLEDVSAEQLRSPYPRISSFYLASCNLSQIPNLLRYHDDLIEVDLSNNQLHGSVPSWMWSKFSSPDGFLYLNLSNNKFTSVENISICPISPICWRFRSIDLSFNKIEGHIPLIGAIYLDYSNNEFSEIPKNYRLYLNGTTYLGLSVNRLTGEMPSSFCEASNLWFLDLSSNNISGFIPSCILGGSELAVLNLTANKFHGIVPHNISKSCHLVILDLSSNNLDGDLPRSLTRCKYLLLFNIRNNRIIDTFPFWLEEIPNLQVVILSSNRLYGALMLASNLPRNKSSFQNLRIIDLASNNFSGPLPPLWFENLRSMVNLSLNVVDAFVRDSLGAAVAFTIIDKGIQMGLKEGVASLMVEIDLSNNKFSGDIPETVGTLSALKALNLSNNAFTGNIPHSFKDLHQIESLDLSWNNLSGEIPQELTSLDSLSKLNLSFNHLVGRIPQSPHFSTFDNTSFVGNPGLCGVPLSKQCNVTSSENNSTSPPTSSAKKMTAIVLLCLFIGLGFGTGFAIVIIWPVIKRAISKPATR